MLESIGIGSLLKAASTAFQGVLARVERQAARRKKLVDEGSRVLTPVTEWLKRTRPAKAVSARDAGEWRLDREWYPLREQLVTYANKHPSETVLELGNRLADEITELVGVIRLLYQEPDEDDALLRASLREMGIEVGDEDDVRARRTEGGMLQVRDLGEELSSHYRSAEALAKELRGAIRRY